MAVDLVLNNNGVQFADGGVMSTTQQLGMQNRLHNGLFNINQRAVSGTVTLAAGAYGHDRWKAGAGGCTYTFATTAGVTTLTISAGTLQQVIEGANLESGTHVLSWTGTAQARIDSGAYGASGITGTSVGGTNQTIEFGTGTVSLPQYEVGTTPSKFAYRPIGLELALCQRYYEAITTGWIIGYSAALANLNLQWRIPKRASPTVAMATNGSAVGNGISNSITGASTIVGYVDGAYMDLSGGTAWTAAAAYSWRGGQVTGNAEL